jgi:hypothetical protein
MDHSPRLYSCLLALNVCFIPVTLFGWTPGTGSPNATNGFVVDTTNRTDVLSFYNCTYTASQNYAAEMGWTGSVVGSSAGTTSDVFKADVLRRVNFYRSLTGLPADITFDTTSSAKAQLAALMMAKNNALNHYPPTTWSCYTADGAMAAANSNLSLGYYGPGAIDGYMLDPGTGNEFVGHRRWILYTYEQSMGTGDVPAQATYSSSNALWVIGNFKSSASMQFITWPNTGYSPFPLMPQRWSIAYPGAQFNNATVTMTVGGTAVPTTIISSTDVGYGDNTLIWTSTGLPTSITTDVPCTVTVSGISGSGVPTSYSYNVTLFDPNFLGDSVTLTGPSSPVVSGTSYNFNQIQEADSYQLRVSQTNATAWTEGAEDSPTPQIQQSTTGTYPLRQTAVVNTGSKAFQLVTPTYDPQSFSITRDIIPTSTSNLTWSDLARFTITTETLSAQISTDNGATWTSLFSRYGVGYTSSALWDKTWNNRSVSLAAYAGKLVNIRFIMGFGNPQDGYISDVSSNNGFFIDNITVSNATQLASTTVSAIDGNSSSFTLNSTTAGAPLVAGTTYVMRIRPSVGNRWFGDGSLKSVTAIAVPPGYSGWVLAQYPSVTEGITGDHDGDGISNGIEYAFGLNPLIPNSSSNIPQPTLVGNNYSVSFTQPAGISGVTYGTVWSVDLLTWNNIPDTGNATTHTFSLNITGKTKVFFRYQISITP